MNAADVLVGEQIIDDDHILLPVGTGVAIRHVGVLVFPYGFAVHFRHTNKVVRAGPVFVWRALFFVSLNDGLIA